MDTKLEKLPNTVILSERLASRRAEASAGAQTSADIQAGATLSGYQILAKIGEGGMGVVYKAHDTTLNRTVALKIMPPHLLKNRDFMHRFRTEAHAQARLNSPNVVTLYSMLEIPAGLVLVMEYVEGQTLQHRLRTHGPLPVADAVWLFEQALQGVECAHRTGIVHRDLKPDNIFITDHKEVKIMDFGVAKIMDNKEPTIARSMVGTLLYISPEQVNGRDADFRSDIYTLGISLFEAVTGRLPFERRTDYGLMHAHILENPPQPRKLRRNLPRELESIILRAIQKDPDKRFQSAAEFRAALLRHVRKPAASGGADPARVPVPATEDAPRRVLGGLGFDLALIAAVLGLIAALGFYPLERHPADEVVAGEQPAPPATVAPTRKARVSPPPPARQAAPVAPVHRAKPAHKPAGSEPPDSEARRPRPSTDNKDRYDTLRKAWGG